MSDWTIITLSLIYVIYKMADRWLDTRETAERESDVYSTTERAEPDWFEGDRIGFQRET